MSEVIRVQCIRCGTAYPAAEMPEGCPACLHQGLPAAVAPVYRMEQLNGDELKALWTSRPPGLWRYAELLPVPSDAPVTLMEGATPLLPMPALQRRFGLGEVFLKDERRNPTGSFKDRFFSVCLTRARIVGANTTAIASSGNGGASAAAYAAAAGLASVVIATPRMSPGWRAAITSTGARLLATASSSDRWRLMRMGVENFGWYPLTNYVNPPVGSNWFGVEGYKSIAYEIAEALDWSAPDWVMVPVSRGDGLAGVWRGFVELYELGMIQKLPRMGAVERYPSLSTALERGLPLPPEVQGDEPTAAVSIGNRVATYQALHTIRQSGGRAFTCSDHELREMVRVAAGAGVFMELSAAAGLAGAAKLAAQGLGDSRTRVVIIVTASGLTDPTAAEIRAEEPLVPVDISVDGIRTMMAL